MKNGEIIAGGIYFPSGSNNTASINIGSKGIILEGKGEIDGLIVKWPAEYSKEIRSDVNYERNRW